MMLRVRVNAPQYPGTGLPVCLGSQLSAYFLIDKLVWLVPS